MTFRRHHQARDFFELRDVGPLGNLGVPVTGGRSIATDAELRKPALANGMRPLVTDGKIKCMNGMTTPDEVASVAQVDVDNK